MRFRRSPAPSARHLQRSWLAEASGARFPGNGGAPDHVRIERTTIGSEHDVRLLRDSLRGLVQVSCIERDATEVVEAIDDTTTTRLDDAFVCLHDDHAQ